MVQSCDSVLNEKLIRAGDSRSFRLVLNIDTPRLKHFIISSTSVSIGL